MSEQSPAPVSRQLIPTVADTPLMLFAERTHILELAERMMMQWPDAETLGKRTMIAAAQLSLAMGLNPFPFVGDLEIYEIQGQIVIDYKIDYLRRKAKEIDTLHWSDQPRPMHLTEFNNSGLPGDCYHATATASRVSEIERLVGIGCPFAEAIKATSRTALGVVFYDETLDRHGKPRKPPRGKTWQWVAEKRAEKEIYRLLGMLQENAATALLNANSGLSADDAPGDPQPLATPHPISQMSNEEINADLFG